MPSPQSQSRHSNGSLLRASTGAAIRRGDIKISDPIPYSQESASSGYRPNSDWPIKSTTVDPQRGRHYSTGNLGPRDAGRASMGPSLVPSTMSTAMSKDSSTQKKTSGFRAALRRMFGSKRKRPSFEDSQGQYYRSDPGNLAAITESPHVARIPTQPVGSVTREEALGSHAHNPDVQWDWDEDQSRPSPPLQRRRNTLPSVVIPDELAEILAGPRDNDITSRVRKANQIDQRHLNRRSRSADALNKMISEISSRNAGIRDRESDIAYWRKSIVENPLPSHLSRQEQADDVTPSTRSETDPSTKLAPLQRFDFGLEAHDGRDASIEDRINTLEVKMIDFEYALAKLQGHNMRPAPHPNVPRRRSIRDPFPETDSGVSTSSREPTSFLSSPDDSPLPSREADESFVPDRTSKATTIRPITTHRQSAASPSSPRRITVDQFDKLMDMLRQERGARLRLEVQVNELQKEIESMRSPVYAEIREINTATTPNRPGTHETPSTNRTLRRSPPFTATKETKQQEQSRFSMSDLDSETDPYDEVYETPQDNKFAFDIERGPSLIGVG